MDYKYQVVLRYKNGNTEILTDPIPYDAAETMQESYGVTYFNDKSVKSITIEPDNGRKKGESYAPVNVKRSKVFYFDQNDRGGTGHGDDSYSDADPGL